MKGSRGDLRQRHKWMVVMKENICSVEERSAELQSDWWNWIIRAKNIILNNDEFADKAIALSLCFVLWWIIIELFNTFPSPLWSFGVNCAFPDFVIVKAPANHSKVNYENWNNETYHHHSGYSYSILSTLWIASFFWREREVLLIIPWLLIKSNETPRWFNFFANFPTNNSK